MDIKNLRTFIHVAELNSFTKAAVMLGYSQSTVSSQIRQLEIELNTPLFDRINHTVVLTERGREVLEYAHQISRLAQELKENMQKEKAVRGHVRLALADSLCDSLLCEQFPAFRKQYPEVTLKIIPAGTEEMFRLLNHNEADAILTLDNHIYNTDYVIVREESVGVHFVTSPNFPLGRQKKIRLEELVNYPFILTEKGMSYRRLMDERLAELSLEIQPVLEVGSVRLICSLVEQGAGVAFLPDYATKLAVQSGRLVPLEVENVEITVWKQLLYHRDKWISPQMESLLQYCVNREFSNGMVSVQASTKF